MKNSNGPGFGHDERFCFRDLPCGGGLLQVWKDVNTLNMTDLEVEGFRLDILQQAWGNGKEDIKMNLGRALMEDTSCQILLKGMRMLQLPRYWES